MFQKPLRTIEFIGGPFDGHVEVIAIEPQGLPEHILCYINENAFRHLEGRDGVSPCNVTSVAIYARLLHRTDWAYFFFKSVAPECVVVESDLKNRNSAQQDR